VKYQIKQAHKMTEFSPLYALTNTYDYP